MSDKLRWGILATGHIARKFAAGVRQTQSGEVVAVGSRTQDKADAFGQEFDIPHRHGSYGPWRPTRMSTPSTSPRPTRCTRRTPFCA